MDEILLRAILAMDAYNRGYAPGIKDLGGLGSKIGDATFSKQSDVDTGTAGTSAGFYAAAYTLSDGSKVISYRGTDGDLGDFATDLAFSTGFGDTTQARLAVAFYKSVIGNGVDPRNGNVIFTGHSLGGGLAGYVGALFGQVGSLYDNIAFEQAALNAYAIATATNPQAALCSR